MDTFIGLVIATSIVALPFSYRFTYLYAHHKGWAQGFEKCAQIDDQFHEKEIATLSKELTYYGNG